MDSTKVKVNKDEEKVEQWKCTIDGKRWTASSKNKCRYCAPVAKLSLVANT